MKNLLLVLGLFFCCCCSSGENGFVIRSADPCNTWAKSGWQEGPDAVLTPELRDGKASHALSPAEIVFYSVQENTVAGKGILINPVLVLTYLENNLLLSQEKEVGDFELRLLKAVGYVSASNKYSGFYPQLVASTYQWRAYQERGLSFAQAQELYPFGLGREKFSDLYAGNAQLMNEIAGTDFALYPDGKGYYQDFSGKVSIENIQSFFWRWNSPLQEKDLFQQPPTENTVVDYENNFTYCQ